MTTGQTKLADERDESRERRAGERLPGYVAKMPMEAGKWMRVGYAYFNPRTETFTVYFDVIPDRRKVVLFRD